MTTSVGPEPEAFAEAEAVPGAVDSPLPALETVDVGALLAADGRRTRRERVLHIVAPFVGVIGFLGLWEALVAIFNVRRFVLPAPWAIVKHIASDPSFYISNARVTIWEAFLGFSIAAVLAMIAATIMAHSRFIERAALPLAVIIQVTPIIAYAPAVVVWLGFGLKPILVITSMVCFVPFLINAIAGLRSVDPNLLELARSVDARKRVIFWKLRFPSSLPHLFSAARIAVGLALIGAVLGEFFAGTTEGLGYAVKTAQARPIQLLEQLWGSIFVLGFIGAVATSLIAAVERVTLRWHQSNRP